MCRFLADHYLQARSYEEAAKWTLQALKEDRCDEESHRRLIQVYIAQGRRSEALQQYHRCERILREELGVQPLPETTRVFHEMLTGAHLSEDKAKL
jgi:DNA-binding SARP family transcriptional activator